MEKDSEIALEALTEFLDAVEAGIQQARHRIKEGKLPEKQPVKNNMPKLSLNVNEIKWQSADGPSGPYEKTDEISDPNYQILKTELSNHMGKMNENGHFYWLFQDGKTIGRKPQKGK